MYVFNEGTIDLPDSWKDQTINIVSSGGPLEQGLTITMTRDTIPWGMEFSEYVEDQIKQLDDALNDLKIRGRKPTKLGKAEAFELECDWKARQGHMHQIITSVALPDNKVIVLTASHPGEMSARQQTEVRRIVSTLNLKRKD